MANVLTAAPHSEEDVLIEQMGYDDHFHEHHDGDKFQSNFITTYIFSQDHKMIAKQFLITGIIMAVVAMGLSILFRLQLAWPDKSFPLLETFLGEKWAEGGRIKPDFYLASLPFMVQLWYFLC